MQTSNDAGCPIGEFAHANGHKFQQICCRDPGHDGAHWNERTLRAQTLTWGAEPVAVVAPASRYPDRREIDAILRDDARRFPAFAAARRAAVLAFVEAEPDASALGVSDAIGMCHAYELRRGGARAPSREAIAITSIHCGTYIVPLTHYERARHL